MNTLQNSVKNSKEFDYFWAGAGAGVAGGVLRTVETGAACGIAWPGISAACIDWRITVAIES